MPRANPGEVWIVDLGLAVKSVRAWSLATILKTMSCAYR